MHVGGGGGGGGVMGRKLGVERGPLKIFLHLLGGQDEIINESMQNHQPPPPPLLIKNERSLGSIPTVAGHIFQARSVWIYIQSNITNITFTWV